MKSSIHNIISRRLLTLLKLTSRVKPSDNYLIFSDPRGGSTWLMEIISQIISKPVIWEPLHITKVSEFMKLGFGWRQYIPESEHWPEAKMTFDKLFKGKILNNWTMQQTSVKALFNTNTLIFKFCRGNALLPYLTSTYDFKNKPILMLRHPFSVVASQLKHTAWNNTKTSFEIPNTKFNEIYLKHKNFLDTLNTKSEVLLATWCITNQIPLNNAKNNIDWITITYEELMLEPEKTISRILKEWQITYDLKKINFAKHSRTTLKGSPETIEKRLTYWEESFSKDEILRFNEILNYFQVKLYNQNKLPLVRFND